MKPNTLAHALRNYFSEQLPRLRGMSPNTIASYRDSISLLIRFVAEQKRRPVARIDVDDIDADQVAKFLHHLETDRANKESTRNIRLAATHAFFRYIAGRFPEKLEHCQLILAVPFKRTGSRPIEYLEHDEMMAVLSAVDRSRRAGRRDYVILAAMFNTGARVQEILSLCPNDLQLSKPFQVKLMGKGRKQRTCPLWPQTAQLLNEHLSERRLDSWSTAPLFVNQQGKPLTRFGVRYILAKYCRIAGATLPSLGKKRLHPHSMRHSTAVHLLQSGVDMVTISQWLGHASINTTNRYATVNLETKRAAISKIDPFDAKTPLASWKQKSSILDWLESL